jgi:signal transduction histidine kinase
LPNQIAFAFVVFSISFFLQQVIGVSTKRLREENGRANSALAELENQQQLLIKYQEHSRKELATYLHDGLQSNLVVLGLQMQQASNSLPKKYQGIGNSFIDEIERMRRTDVRSAIRQLSPELEGLSLRPALQELFKRYTKAVEIELELDDAAQEPKVPTGLKLAAYRIVEQALINAVVHAQPAKIEVSLSLSENEMTVQVTNDGKAQGEEIAPGTGFAIVGAWCKAFDGSFHLSVENGQTALTATLSLPGAGTN